MGIEDFAHKEGSMPKKNVREVPQVILAQLKRLKNRHIVAACVRVIAFKEINAGRFKHLGIQLGKDGLIIPDGPVLPPRSGGKYSDRNINGYVIVRKDLQKQTLYHSHETPNWGDSSKGTHTVDLPYEKYPRDFYGPQHTRIKIGTENRDLGREKYLFSFEVDRILDRQDKSFKKDLLVCLNLLQENVGACGVQKAGVKWADYLKTVTVAWEVLPPGTKEEALRRLFGSRKASTQEKNTASDRYEFFMRLGPNKLVYGTSGLQRYFGAMLENDLVVFENIEYGNAIYVMFEDWEDLSRKTRTELLSGRFGRTFERVLHTGGWKGRVRRIVSQHQERGRRSSPKNRKSSQASG